MRRAATPSGAEARIYRELAWGDLATVYMLDTRQFRDDQPCGDGNRVDCAERLLPSRTMLGTTQEQWLRGRAARSQARWDVLGQQVFFGDLLRPLPVEAPGVRLSRQDAPLRLCAGQAPAGARIER